MGEIKNTITNVAGASKSFTPLSPEPIDKEHIGVALESLIGEYGWILLIAILTIIAKDMIINFVQGLLVFMGNDFNNDDIIYISGRQARIVRVGVRNTVFYMSDRRSKMLVPNEQLKHLTIEKALPKNGGQPYLPKASDPGFVGWEEVPLPPSPTKIEVIEKTDKLKRPRK